jgi:hypothetical protein
MRKRRLPIDENRPLSITDFCYVEGVSTYTYNQTWRKRGLIPEETRYPGSQIVRITPQARREWRERFKQQEIQDQIKRDRERRTAIAKNAGKVAVKSRKHPRTGAKQSAEPPSAPKRGRGRPRKYPQAAE